MSRHEHTTDRRKGVVRYTNAERKKRYRKRHPERAAVEAARRDKSYFSRYTAHRYRTDPTFNLIHGLRARTAKALRGTAKSAATLELLGCSAEDLRTWIELQFKPGMSWANRSEWEVDHKGP